MKNSFKFSIRLAVSLALGWLAAYLAYEFGLLNFFGLKLESRAQYYAVMTLATVVVGALFYFTVSWLAVILLSKRISRLEEHFVNTPLNELLASLIGLTAGLVVAVITSVPFAKLPAGFSVVLPFCLIFVFGALGLSVGHRRSGDLRALKSDVRGRSKILDTSVIIDGRILDIIQTGFVEGKILVPNFVLDELRHIADSSDPIRKGRGRQGLDVLNKIREQQLVPVEILEWRSEKFMDVDSRLLQMAGELDAFIVTNDYNLNRVAEFQMVSVLNINELSNALKAVVVPGQEIIVSVVKTGKEADQGVAYLNDGTMVVIEDGKKYVGEEISVTVTSILQTAAGRMIFSKPMD